MCKSLRQRVLRYNRKRKHFFFMEQQGISVYGNYFFSHRECWLYGMGAIGVVIFFSFFFYRSWWAVLLLWPVGFWVYLTLEKEKGEKRREQLEQEFQDCMQSFSANLRAGSSVEHGFLETLPDMRALYGNDSLMGKELLVIKKGLANNLPLEKLLTELGDRSCSTNIKEFGEVFSIARASGGNLPEVLTSTAGLIGEKMALQQQIRVTISGRKLEQNIMNAIPFLLVLYIEMTNRGFFDVLYEDWPGRLIMTGCLLVYMVAFFMARKICHIKA